MPSLNSFLKTFAMVAVSIAIITRVEPLNDLVFGSGGFFS